MSATNHVIKIKRFYVYQQVQTIPDTVRQRIAFCPCCRDEPGHATPSACARLVDRRRPPSSFSWPFIPSRRRTRENASTCRFRRIRVELSRERPDGQNPCGTPSCIHETTHQRWPVSAKRTGGSSGSGRKTSRRRRLPVDDADRPREGSGGQ